MDVVIVGGFSSTGAPRLKTLEREIKKNFPKLKVHLPEYFERYGKIGQYLRKFTIPEYAKIVDESLNFSLVDEPILIGYSMGGIITRFLVEKLGFEARAVILVGTPNQGVKLGWLEKKLLGKLFTLPCVKDMNPNSDFLYNLNSSPVSERYFFIGSDRDERVPIDSAIPVRKEGKFFILHTDHSGLIPKKLEMIPNSAVPVIIEILHKINQT